MQNRPSIREQISGNIRSLLERRNDELETIREIFRTINGGSDLRSMLESITRITTEALQADSCSIYLLDGQTQRLILKATTGLFKEALDVAFLPWGKGLTGWAAENREPVAVADAQRDPRFFELANTREKPFASLMAVPLVSQDRLVGAMNAQTLRERAWDEADIGLLQLIADVVAGVLERAVLYEETERRVMDLSTVAEVSKAVVAPRYLDETLRVVTEMAANAVGARRCSLLLLDEAERRYVTRAVHDKIAATPPEPGWSPADPPLRDAGQLSQPVFVQDVAAFLRDDYRDWAADNQLNTLLVVPLTLNKRVIGLMNIWAGQGVSFNRDQQQLCKTLANQISLAIENAHLVGNAAIVKEMNHRVKNNLQNVVMLLQLQMGDPKAQAARGALQDSVNRIMSIAAVHDALAQEGFRLVDVRDVIQRVVGLVHSNMTMPGQNITISVEGEPVKISSRAATAVALSVNELVANAMEHAFAGREAGSIIVRLAEASGVLHIEVRDDGLGDAALEPGQRPPSLGLSIVDTLVKEDLHGHFALDHTPAGSVGIIEAPLSYA